MTPEEFKKAMEAILKEEADEGDREESHYQADKLLCKVLELHGYQEGVEVFHKLPKWYV